MRNDLTTAFETAMAANGRAPVQLLVFHFTTGDVFVSDRALGPVDGLDNTYSALVEDFGVLEDVSAADPGELSAEIRQMSISIWNGGAPPFSDHFLRDDPENVVVDLYQWFVGLTEADKALIDRFLISDPISFDERLRLVHLDLVSQAINFDQAIGDLLSAADWPTAKTADIGKPIDYCFGKCGCVPTLCAKTAPSATLNGSILLTSMAIPVNENLDDLGFSAAGTIEIGDEWVRYSSRTASAFNVVQRGYLSEAADHLDRDEIVEKMAGHTYLIGKGPMGGVSSVLVGGFEAPADIYNVILNQNPARVEFLQKPYAYRFAAGSTFLDMQFDTVTGDNSAVQAHYAYDAADDATAARINESHRRLALRQTTVNANRGAIVKAYLAIEHWESSAFLSDYVEVWVEGVGVVGRLSRPNVNDTIDIEAEVDIDHGHSHSLGEEHTHNFYDPVLQSEEVQHGHTVSGEGTESCTSGDPEQLTLMAPYTPNAWGEQKIVYFPDAPTTHEGGYIRFYAHLSAGKLLVGPGYWAREGENLFPVSDRSGDSTLCYSFTAFGDGVYTAGGASVTVDAIEMIVKEGVTVDPTITGASTYIVASGVNVATSSDKAVDDVDDLTTDNQPVEVVSTTAATRTHVNMYDITEHVDFDWGWFTGRNVWVTYQGSADDRNVYILHCFFEIEYRKKVIQYSDEVSVYVDVGLVDTAGTITGTAGGAIRRADHVLKYLLTNTAGMDADFFDAETWAAAGGRLAAKGYAVDGKLSASLTTKEALKAVLFQNRLRLFYNAGVSKLVFAEPFENWPDGQAIGLDDYQLKSLAISRQAASNIINTVNLFYSRDWTVTESGAAAYDKSTVSANAESVARHGVRANDDKFFFDLVRSDVQAVDLAGFFSSRYAWPSNYIELNAYLPLFALEKNDAVNITSNFHRLRKAKGRVIGSRRVFGSGKLSQINHICFLLECLRYILIEQAAADVVNAFDALSVSVGREGEYVDLIHLSEQLTFHDTGAPADAVVFADELSIETLFDMAVDEAIMAGDECGVTIGVNIDDPVKVLDDAQAWRTFGFGGGGFGAIGFGGWIVWYNRAPDEVQASMVLSVYIQPETVQESATVEDDLYFSCGFGCPLGSGFGRGPFGQ